MEQMLDSINKIMTIVRESARAEALEEAAKIAENWQGNKLLPMELTAQSVACVSIAESIRNLAEKNEEDIATYNTYHKPSTSSVQGERNFETARYAEWFKRTYETVSKAGGDPISFIEGLTPATIDAMVRNDIALVYKDGNKNE